MWPTTKTENEKIQLSQCQLCEQFLSFAITLLFSPWPLLVDKKMSLLNTFSFTLFLKETSWKDSYVMGLYWFIHCIIKGLFCIVGLLWENKHKERQHGTNCGSFFESTLPLSVIHSLWWQHKPLLPAGNVEQKQESWIKYSMGFFFLLLPRGDNSVLSK